MNRDTASECSRRIPGVEIYALCSNDDARGSFTEIFRDSWRPQDRYVQWNVVSSRRGTLRGVHVHRKHSDYLVLLSGEMWVGLSDLRSDTHGQRREMIHVTGTTPVAVAIPTGVAHGFFFPVDSLHVYAVTEYYDVTDEMGCRWDDAELSLAWPAIPEFVSERDRRLPTLNTLRQRLAIPASERFGLV